VSGTRETDWCRNCGQELELLPEQIWIHAGLERPYVKNESVSSRRLDRGCEGAELAEGSAAIWNEIGTEML